MKKEINYISNTTQKIYNMSALDQLDFVDKYFTNYKRSGNLKSFADLYTAVFFPLALGKSNDFVLQTTNKSAKDIAFQNAGILKIVGKSNQPYITAGDLRKYFEIKNKVSFPSYYKQ